jgi:signal transduction histidine kinase
VTLPALLDSGFGLQSSVDVVQSRLTGEDGHDVDQMDRKRSRPSADEFASMVTHELRNPLNALAGWLHLLAAEPPAGSDAGQRALAGARRAVEQQLAQIDMVGQVLRLSGGSVPPAGDPVELGGLLAAEVRRQSASAAASGHDILLKYSVPPAAGERHPGYWVAVDRGLLQTAAGTLMSFALRHGSPGAVLELEVGRHPPREVSLVMRIDEGQDDGLSVWHAFGHTGSRLALDLYLSVLAIESYGGSVRARGAAAGGHELEVRLPVAHSKEPEPRP